MQDPVTTVDGFTYERELIESWLLAHDTSPSSGAPLSSKRLTPNVALKAAIQEWSQISRAKNEIEDRRRQVLEQQQFVLQREQALYQVMQAQRTLQIAQARQEHEVCTAQGLRRPTPGSGLDRGEAPVGAIMQREVMQTAEGQRRAEEERAKERRRMEELEFEKQEKALQAQLKALEEEQRQREAEEKAAEEQRRREREAQKVAAAMEKKMRAEEKRLKKEEKERLRLQRKREQEEEAKKNQARNKEIGKSAKDRWNVASNDTNSPAASVRAESHRQLDRSRRGVVRGVGSLSASVMHGFSFVVTWILSLGSGGGKMMSSLGYVFLAYLVYMCYEIIDVSLLFHSCTCLPLCINLAGILTDWSKAGRADTHGRPSIVGVHNKGRTKPHATTERGRTSTHIPRRERKPHCRVSSSSRLQRRHRSHKQRFSCRRRSFVKEQNQASNYWPARSRRAHESICEPRSASIWRACGSHGRSAARLRINYHQSRSVLGRVVACITILRTTVRVRGGLHCPVTTRRLFSGRLCDAETSNGGRDGTWCVLALMVDIRGLLAHST